MLEQLKYLIEFQLLEDQKNRLLRSREETPQQVVELEKEFTRLEGGFLAKKAEYDQAKKMRRSLEQDTADLESKVGRIKQRTREVKTNKEYQALLKEIEDIKRDMTAKEDQLLEVMESIDSLGNQIDELSREVENRREQFMKSKAEFLHLVDQTDERIARLEALQQEVRDKMEPNLLKRCLYLLEKQGKIAVAPVQGGVCQICHIGIPPQKFIELQRDENILQCPHCHRFIYWSDHEVYGTVREELQEF